MSGEGPSTRVTDLPQDVLLRCLGYLPAKDILAFAVSCTQTWRLLRSENNELWKEACAWTRDLDSETFEDVCRRGDFISIYSALMRVRKASRRYRCSRQLRRKEASTSSDGGGGAGEGVERLRPFRKVCLKNPIKLFGLLLPKLSQEDLDLLIMGNSLLRNDAFMTQGVKHETFLGEPLYTLQVYRAFGTVYTEEEPCFEICYDARGVMINASVNRKSLGDSEGGARDGYDIYELTREARDEFGNVGCVGVNALFHQNFVKEKDLYPFASELSAGIILSSVVRHIVQRNRLRLSLLRRVSILHSGSSQATKVRAQIEKSICFVQAAGIPILDLSAADEERILSKKDLDKVLKGSTSMMHTKFGNSGTADLFCRIGSVLSAVSELTEALAGGEEGKSTRAAPIVAVLPGHVNNSKSARKGRNASVEEGWKVIKQYLNAIKFMLLQLDSVKHCFITCERSSDAELYRNFIVTCFEDNMFNV
mmetsp:Transcript_20837/g.43969  ORF Transcript_20837/g.43969 Transcript_20837/m.43969 type:complete len:479 (+) Transcript_20837:22-1458(+)